jgi:cytochrome c2
LSVARYALVAFYVLASVAMPFAHHDLACHLKSSTHCATCNVGTSIDPNSAGPVLDTAILRDAGRADQVSSLAVASPALLRSAGRSPPSTTL